MTPTYYYIIIVHSIHIRHVYIYIYILNFKHASVGARYD